jgi:two-component system C4-dicarboxylate transport response regulator DctD
VLGLREPLLAPDRAFEGQRLSLAQQVESFERALIERCLMESGGRISAVMERLDIPRRTLSEKMARLGLDRKRYTSTAGPNSANESAPVGGKLPIR